MSVYEKRPVPPPFPTQGVQVALLALCNDCRHVHPVQTTPTGLLDCLAEWEVKHRGHDIEFVSERRTITRSFEDRRYRALDDGPWWLAYSPNANIKISYAASAAMTCTLASLASSTTFLVGRGAASVDNSSTLYVDYRITAKIMVGTTPTVDTELRVYGYAALNDTPTYPDTITGADAAITLTNAYVLEGGLTLLGATAVAATSNVGYPLRCLTTAEAFGHAPKRWGLFVAHNTVAALHATGGNHVLTQIGAFFTSV